MHAYIGSPTNVYCAHYTELIRACAASNLSLVQLQQDLSSLHAGPLVAARGCQRLGCTSLGEGMLNHWHATQVSRQYSTRGGLHTCSSDTVRIVARLVALPCGSLGCMQDKCANIGGTCFTTRTSCAECGPANRRTGQACMCNRSVRTISVTPH